MTDQTFSRAELRQLAPGDLADLLRMAAPPDSDNQPWAAAMLLGLDPTNPNDRKAVEAAWDAAGYVPDSFSAPVGAGQPGVRSDLTPTGAGEPAPDDGMPLDPRGTYVALSVASDVAVDAGVGLPEPDAEGAADLADAIAESAARGRPFMAGTFALYGDPSGAVVLVTEDAAGNVKRSVVPRKIVRLALGLMSGERSGMAGFLAKRLGRG